MHGSHQWTNNSFQICPALANIVSRGQSTQSRLSLDITELAQAVIDDDPTAAAEFANELFDKESVKLLK
jgi:hypothetical protein